MKKKSVAKTLKSRIFRGGVWMGVGGGLEQTFRLLRNMVLARILAPEAFGLMAIIVAVNTIFDAFTEVGIKESIIQNPRGQENKYLNGAWYFAFGRALALYLILFMFAPLVSRIYENPEIVPLLRISFLRILFNGMMSTKAYVAIKQMRLKSWAMILHGGGICGILTAILLAFVFHNVWALVIGFSVESAARCILSYVICPFFPHLRFDQASLRSLFKYARGIFGLPILTFLFMKCDIFVVGKLYPLTELGLYSMAASLAWVPLNFISSLTVQITMPAYSEKQSDKDWINKWTLNITSLLVSIVFPLFFFIAFYGRDVLIFIYGEQYGVVSLPFTILFATAVMRTCSVPIATVFLAVGRPELQRLFTGTRAISIIVIIFPAVKWFGLTGAATAGLISMLIGYLFQGKRIHEITGLPLYRYSSIFLRGLCISSCVIIVWFLTKNFSSYHPIINIIPGLAGCLLSYVIAAKFFFGSKTIDFKLF